MPLTPADIHNMAFRKSPLGRRGYDTEGVDALLDSVSEEMIGLLEENSLLRDQVRRTDAAAESELVTVSRELELVRRTCEQAQRKARALESKLADMREHENAEPAPDDGADRVLAVAHRTAEQHVDEADREAGELIRNARAESALIAGHARQTALDIAQRSRRDDSEAAADLESKRTATHQEISELAEFAAQYRAALEAHIRHQSQI